MRNWLRDHHRLLWLLGAAAVYLVLAAYQLGLPGLHYDEAKEAGINAMELVGGAPVTAFRGATLDLFGVRLPLMVQDYIGALNVYLAVPILAMSGVGVPNLRALSVLIGLLTLILAERSISEWIACCDRAQAGKQGRHVQAAARAPHTGTAISLASIMAAVLLAVSPTFVFWSRQGIFVTNLMQPLCLLAVWQGIRWMRTGRPASLVMAALGAGLALYAKLLAVWIIGPFVVLMVAWWAYRRANGVPETPSVSLPLLFVSAVAFLLPLVPLALFNVKTGGTLSTVLGNAARSYYGVDNLNVAANFGVRAGQIVRILAGDHFWYLGGSYANRAAPWLAAISIVAGVWRAPRCTIPPLALVFAALLASLFTVSDLFVTHYALLYPFVVAAAAISLDRIWWSFAARDRGSALVRAVVGVLLLVWIAGNLSASIGYHRALSQSGGLADHSDATYHLAYFLRYNGMGAPVVLDWGIEAPVRYLSEGAVQPIEIFGYESLAQPDPQFVSRLDQFLTNPDSVYLLHAREQTVFQGRREVFLSAVAERNLRAQAVEIFGQRDGVPLYEVWRVAPAP